MKNEHQAQVRMVCFCSGKAVLPLDEEHRVTVNLIHKHEKSSLPPRNFEFFTQFQLDLTAVEIWRTKCPGEECLS